jgi:hypothetical protein
MEILNGILIAALCVGSAFGGFVLCMKVRKPEVRHVIRPLLDDGDKEIEDRASGRPMNIETGTASAEDFHKRFNSQTASGRLKNATRAG